MNICWHLGTILARATDEAPAPEDVKAGWVAFGLFLLLGAAVVFLAFSFRKQLRKIDFEEDRGADSDDGAAPDNEDSTSRGE